MALAPNKLSQAEFARVVYYVTPELGTTINQVLDPKYWAHVAAQLRPRCRIEVLAEDNSYFAELLVVACDKTWASVAVLRYVDLVGKKEKTEKPPVSTEGKVTLDEFNTEAHYVDFVAGQSKGRVVNRDTKNVVKDGFPSKKDAAKWMREHEEALANQQKQAAQNLME